MRIRSKTCLYDGKNQFNGIFQYISNKTSKTNPLDSNVFAANASLAPEKVKYLFTDTTTPNYWISKGLNNYFVIDFKKNRVEITAYTFYAATWDFLEEYTILGSNDNKEWFFVDNPTLASRPTSTGSMAYVVFYTNFSVKCRYLKVINTGTRHSGEDYFVLHRIELFGAFHSYNDIPFSCQHTLDKSNILMFSFMALIS